MTPTLYLLFALSAPVPKSNPPVFYHPVVVGTKWVMKSGSTEIAYVIGRVIEKNGKYVVSIGLDGKDGLVHTYVTEHVSADGVYREFKEYDDRKPQIALVKAPLRAGESWEYTIKTGGVEVKDKWVRTVAGEETVKVTAGEFQAVRIDWVRYADEKKVSSGSDWYAVNIGLVKQIVGDNVTELISFTPAEAAKKDK